MRSSEDEADLCQSLLNLFTLPKCLLRALKKERGRVSEDLGIKSVITYVLCCRVLGRLSHVQCPKKQMKAVRQMEIMVTGGIAKKRKRLGGAGSNTVTRNRVLIYIERCIMSFICEDFKYRHSLEIHTRDLFSSVCKGDELLDDILSATDESPSFSHVLPITIVSFVWVLVELMVSGSMDSYEGVDIEKLAEFHHFDVYCALEKVTLDILDGVHPGRGVIGGGDGRPIFSPSSVHGRDGELSRIAISNTTLASLLWMGSRMRDPVTPSKKGKEEDAIGLESFFPFVLDDILNSVVGDREYQSTMEEAEDFLMDAPADSFVTKRILSTFFKSYETLLRCNAVTLESFKGPGVLLRSGYVPAIVKCRQMKNGNRSVRDSVLKDVEKDAKTFRRTKDSCLDSEREVVKKNGVKTSRCVCSFAKDLCQFLIRCARFAEKIINEAGCENDGNDGNKEKLRDMRTKLFNEFILGLFARDLSGNISGLYEEYVYSSLMRHFDESDGVAKTLLRSGKRRHVFRGQDGKKRTRKGKDAEQNDGTEVLADLRKEFSLEEEDWGATDGT